MTLKRTPNTNQKPPQTRPEGPPNIGLARWKPYPSHCEVLLPTGSDPASTPLHRPMPPPPRGAAKCEGHKHLQGWKTVTALWGTAGSRPQHGAAAHAGLLVFVAADPLRVCGLLPLCTLEAPAHEGDGPAVSLHALAEACAAHEPMPSHSA